MNKRLIVLIALVACMFAMPASAEMIEVRGNVADAACAAAGITWDAHNFGAFWYDLDDDLLTECLVLEAGTVSDWDRTIDEGCLSYTTCPLYQEYELYACEGLTVNGSEGYYLEGWMGLPYVAIGGRADKLCELLVEFTADDKKILATGEAWDIGGGFALTAENLSFPYETPALCDSCTLSLSKNGVKLDEQIIYVNTSDGQDLVYTYAPDIGGEEHVPVFSCCVDAVFNGTGSDVVQLKYVFLIDNEVLEINTSETYGAMEVVVASSSRIVLGNDCCIDLSMDSTEHIMGNMYFKTAYDDRLRFYPFVEYTEPGTYKVRGNVADAACAAAGIAWDARNFAAFWYDLDDDLSTECLVLAAGAISDSDRTINEGDLTYTTMPVYQHYELWSREGLVVDGDTYNLERGYYIEGWLGETYIAVNGNADKLVKLLVEFEDDDKKTLSTGEAWDIGNGFALTAKQIDLEGDKVWLILEKDGKELDSEVITTGGPDMNDSVYTYTEYLANEDDVPVFSGLVDVIDRDTNTIEIMYVFLIDNDVLEIDTSDTYGAMEVVAASSSQVILRNEYTIHLDPDTTEHIMGNMYFETADDDILRFYPFIGGEETEEEEDTIPAIDTDNDGVPDAWDADNSTPADYWTDSDGRGRMWGDMNRDGKLTSADALMLLQAVVGKIDL
ncbi:MAG: S-layer protein domain-containing protein [Euryarchaeota archaeon]|nr:S-layer protein domain-containing protein [Euryarchaeota archaeon]